MSNYYHDFEEPKPPKECMIGIKVTQRRQIHLDLSSLDIDTEALLSRAQLAKGRASKAGKSDISGRSPMSSAKKQTMEMSDIVD